MTSERYVVEFNQLEIFIQVTKLGSFSKAAKKLYLTQPTISNHIQNLENELETVLIDRKSKKFTLTGAGQVFFKYAVDLVNTRDKAKHSIDEYKGNIKGNLEITTSSIPENYILPEMIKGFSALYPQVTYTINHKDSKAVCHQIIDGKINFGIVGAKYDDLSLVYCDFYEDELILATPNNESYTWSTKDPLAFKDLLNEQLIIRKEGSGSRSLLEKGLAEIKMPLKSLKVSAVIENNELIKKMIVLNLGISFISSLAIKKELESGLMKAYRIEGLNLHRKFYFVYSKNRTLSPVAEAFKTFLLETNRA